LARRIFFADRHGHDEYRTPFIVDWQSGWRISMFPEVVDDHLRVDPVSDVAVLGAPDGQVFWDEWEAYEELLEQLTPWPCEVQQE
jgi:hypothetical protein